MLISAKVPTCICRGIEAMPIHCFGTNGCTHVAHALERFILEETFNQLGMRLIVVDMAYTADDFA